MQQRKSTFSILFYIKRKKPLKNGDAGVYMRVIVDGRFLEASLKRGVNPKVWNEKKHRSTDRDRLSVELNDYLGHSDICTTKIYAKVIDKSIAEQMGGLAAKFGSQKLPITIVPTDD